jgi:hypothetical protein
MIFGGSLDPGQHKIILLDKRPAHVILELIYPLFHDIWCENYILQCLDTHLVSESDCGEEN